MPLPTFGYSSSYMTGRYKGNITRASLKVPESRLIAGLLIDGVDDQTWRDAIVVRNILQKRSPSTAVTVGTLLRARLETMGLDLCVLVRDGSRLVATHAVLATAIKHSALLGDFLDLAVREQLRLFKPTLTAKLWFEFLAECRARDSKMPEWTEATTNKLGQNIFRILAEAGYINDTKSRRLQPLLIAEEVLTYLREHDERYVLRCIQVGR